MNNFTRPNFYSGHCGWNKTDDLYTHTHTVPKAVKTTFESF
jgi:hypothetical protein